MKQEGSSGRKHVMNTAKAEVESLLKNLPENCSMEDIEYHLYVLKKIKRGLEVADQQGTLSQEEAERRLHKWITK
jgi:hypothetical protein